MILLEEIVTLRVVYDPPVLIWETTVKRFVRRLLVLRNRNSKGLNAISRKYDTEDADVFNTSTLDISKR